jgi:hypothetical protein
MMLLRVQVCRVFTPATTCDIQCNPQRFGDDILKRVSVPIHFIPSGSLGWAGATGSAYYPARVSLVSALSGID